VKTNNPFLPGISTKLDGKTRRRQLDDIRKCLRDLLDNSISELGTVFSEILPFEMLQKQLMALLLAGGTHSVMRLHQKREGKVDWRCGKKLGPDSRLVIWDKPPSPGNCAITEEEWAALPDTMEVRIVRTRGKDRGRQAEVAVYRDDLDRRLRCIRPRRSRCSTRSGGRSR